MSNHPDEESLVMLYYGEPQPEALRAHLNECPDCRQRYDALVRVLDACDDLPVPEPPLGFESRMWHRLESRITPPRHFYRNWLTLAAVAAMLVVAFLAGRFSRPPQAPSLAISDEGRQRVLAAALSDHIERSQMVLLDLTNEPEDASLDRDRARRLLAENRLYRQTAAGAGKANVAQTLDELERLLVDISHGASTEEVKSRIDSESLLFKLRVLGSNLRQTDKPKPEVQSPRSALNGPRSLEFL